MRKRIIAANWKMNKTLPEALSFVGELRSKINAYSVIDTVVCVPHVFIERVVNESEKQINIGAQNCFFEDKGAYTGETSPEVLKQIGVSYVILGHSERREIFQEQDDLISKKVAAVFRHKMIPILCVGESLAQREEGITKQVVEKQVLAGIQEISLEDISSLVIAYEPIWAIGTGKTSTPIDANEVCQFIRSTVAKKYNEQIANHVRIQYGGSVKPENIQAYLSQEHIDGALVGGASLELNSFVSLLEASK